MSIAKIVAPLVGAWIEIDREFSAGAGSDVAPLVGAWIEIAYMVLVMVIKAGSLPLWERGLKS